MADLYLERTEDPAAFMELARDYLDRDPVLGTVVATILQRALDDRRPPPDHPRWWAAVLDRDRPGEVLGVVMRTAPFAPYPLYALPMSDEVAHFLAGELHRAGEHVPGMNGGLPAAEVMAAELARLQGGRVEVSERTRLFVLEDVTDLVEPPTVPGTLRVATEADLDPVFAWFLDFMPAAAAQAGRVDDAEGERFDEAEVLARIATGRVWLWEVAGEIVHLTAANPASGGVARVGPVYTPPEHRGKGYAGVVVGMVTRLILEAGERACLFTDQANPVSNHVYVKLGYRAVTDMAHLAIRPS